MDAAVEKILREFEKRSEKEWEQMREMDLGKLADHLDDFLLAVGPATGQLINLLVKEAESKTIVEIGSSYGYSTAYRKHIRTKSDIESVLLPVGSGLELSRFK